MSLNRYFERIFEYMDKKDREKKPTQIVEIKSKRYCNNFSKGEDGFCKHYMGCRVNIESCRNKCGEGG